MTIENLNLDEYKAAAILPHKKEDLKRQLRAELTHSFDMRFVYRLPNKEMTKEDLRILLDAGEKAIDQLPDDVEYKDAFNIDNLETVVRTAVPAAPAAAIRIYAEELQEQMKYTLIELVGMRIQTDISNEIYEKLCEEAQRQETNVGIIAFEIAERIMESVHPNGENQAQELQA